MGSRRARGATRGAVLTLRGLIGTPEADSARAVVLCRQAVALETAAGAGLPVALGALGGALALDGQFAEAADILSESWRQRDADRLELRRASCRSPATWAGAWSNSAATPRSMRSFGRPARWPTRPNGSGAPTRPGRSWRCCGWCRVACCYRQGDATRARAGLVAAVPLAETRRTG